RRRVAADGHAAGDRRRRLHVSLERHAAHRQRARAPRRPRRPPGTRRGRPDARRAPARARARRRGPADRRRKIEPRLGAARAGGADASRPAVAVPQGGSMRQSAFILSLTLALVVLGAASPAGAQTPAGEVAVSFHVTIAPAWFDPSTAPPQITPFGVL